MDFAFGTLSTDELKLYFHKLMRQGLRHGHEISPRRPTPGQPFTLLAAAGVDLSVDGLACYYTTDGTEPTGSRGFAHNGTVLPFRHLEAVWDSFAWGYISRWAVTLPGFPAGTLLRYRIGAWADSGEEVFADFPDLKLSAENAASRHFNQHLPPDPTLRWGSPTPGDVFALRIGQPGAPEWAREAVIYHLMIDRFYPGEGRNWRQTEDLTTFCGGTLQGVLEKIDYIAGFGANTLWLSPLWASPSWHGYDTTDYREVQPRYGDKEILRRLIGAAHERGLRVLFDMACNHLSDRHPLFQAALADSASPYRKWFHFEESEVGYRAFFGVPSMPEVNLAHPEARDWMVENALYWLREFDIDGYRLDYAQGPRPDFWSYFVSACKSEKPATYYFGEIIEPPDMLQAYAGRLDGTLDFHINHALRQTYAFQNWSEADYHRFLARHGQYMNPDFVSPAFLDNHDMDRLLFIADGDRIALLTALEALLKLPNPPVLLYGTEVGLSQRRSAREAGLDVIREPMLWGEAQDKELLARTMEFIRERANR